MLADWLHITPVLRTEADGRITANGVLPGRQNLLPRFARHIAKRSDRHKVLRLAIGHALCEEDAMKLEEYLRDSLPNVVTSTITDLGSALGVHGGPGALVVAIQEVLDPENFRK
jgi:fatty acid-binding protein DegV